MRFFGNIDVSLGALAMGWCAWQVAGLTPPSAWWLALPLAVWTIYTLDRLIDSRLQSVPTHRHDWHHRHRRFLVPASLISGSAAVIAAAALPAAMWVAGGIAATMAVLHVLLRGRLPIGKEVLIAIGYAAGTWGTVWALRPTVPALAYGTLACALCAWMNLIMFAWHERSIDGISSTPSSCSHWAFPHWPWIQVSAACALLALAAAWYADVPDPAIGLLLLIGGCQCLPFLGCADWWRRGDRYRLLGDGAFLFAALRVCWSADG